MKNHLLGITIEEIDDGIIHIEMTIGHEFFKEIIKSVISKFQPPEKGEKDE